MFWKHKTIVLGWESATNVIRAEIQSSIKTLML